MENIVFDFNTYYPCATKRIKVSKQHTVRLHVEDIMCSHMKPKVNDKFKEWMKRNYDKHGEVKANTGRVYGYLEMNFDFTEKEKVKIKMDNYI